MSNLMPKFCTAFDGHRMLSSGALADVALAVKAAQERGATDVILVFDEETGRVVDLDLRGSATDILERLSYPPDARAGHHTSKPDAQSEAGKADDSAETRGRGRPKLGVVAREVTLLPRHWDWLASQSGGASVVLRRLVDEARRNTGERQRKRAAQEAAYHFMHAIAGDLPDYEEATRALFADDRAQLEQRIAPWPQDVRAHVLRLADGPRDQKAAQ